ncbi:hypothetical protein ACL598_17035 [Bordetella bronchialis]|uniref:hypothetical protein n=1 Tax=Bordetella bronchialis TaxID=463025 RepID=UPI003D08063B
MTTQDHTAALMPCPFCGGTTIHVSPPTCKRTDKYDPADRGFPIVHCGGCGAEANGKNWDESCASAIAAWNTRAQPQQPAGWKPIETAPKDGTRFIGLGPTPSDGGIEARETCWSFFGQGSLAKAAFDRGEGPSGNWRWCEPIHNWASSWNPTHWMPLPPPPGAHPSQQEEDARDAARLAELVLSAVEYRKDKDWQLMHVDLSEAAELARKMQCTCPSGDGSLRHPCPQHPAINSAGEANDAR